MLTTALAVGAGVVAAAFAAATYERWLLRRRPHDLSWSLALVLFALAAGALAWGSATGWTSMSFRLFYALGAIANVPFLAAGQLQLQLGARRSRLALPTAALFAAFSLGVTLEAPLRAALPADRLPRGSEVFGPLPRVLAAAGSGVSATIVFVGTLLGIVGIVRARRRGAAPAGAGRRVAGLALLALGTATLSASGTLNSVLGEMEAFSVTLTIGITLLFAGFLVSSLPSSPTARP